MSDEGMVVSKKDLADGLSPTPINFESVTGNGAIVEYSIMSTKAVVHVFPEGAKFKRAATVKERIEDGLSGADGCDVIFDTVDTTGVVPVPSTMDLQNTADEDLPKESFYVSLPSDKELVGKVVEAVTGLGLQ